MQALILAAGSGSRLDSLGMNTPKCLTMVAGISILERAINNLLNIGITTIYITVKHKADDIMEYINNRYSNVSEANIIFIDERQYPDFYRNNIYSFVISLPYLNMKEDLVLLEGDVIFNQSILTELLSSKKSKVVLSTYAKYLNGNGVIVDKNKCLSLRPYINKDNLYKTVNIYYIAKQYLKQLNKKDIKKFLKSHDYNHYYEECFDWHKFAPVIVSPTQWYEIDTPADYYAANIIYSTGEEKYNLLCQRYGGHWRLPGLIDCCYLTNPFFHPDKIIKSLSGQLDSLITSYPAGDVEYRRYAADLLSVKDYHQILVGNGASELIKVLGRYFNDKKTYTSIPSFNEYLESFNCIQHNTIEDVDIYIIINPNNPMSTYTDYEEICRLIKSYPNIIFIIDESFNDFVDQSIQKSFIGLEYDNIIVVKSLGKTYGVNGLKLGVLYSANIELINQLQKLMPSWNINSVAQEFLSQIKYYNPEYVKACAQLAIERNRMIRILRENIPNIIVNESQTDFITIQLLNIDANKICVSMLDKYNIFIKNLNNKKGLEEQNYIRVSINDENTNNYVIKCLKECIENVK